ncbi:dihydrolipoyl dehydrogenase family protein [Cohaesibacter haloalkalitolerans]|uniref:dihydrolipoyl dehydrogenase family protein n=1 Tax=Cohaesibacter haloalkalitolerans TaxID=1162980 RepID=UPI000E652C62|nr:FAD-dependent oxidoreductase [Cohaesibacter haloalkalitolerans]
MSEQFRADICIIGAGSGGLTVAAAMAAFGETVVLFEKGDMGGDCLNTGCVPSKAMIAAAKRAQSMREASRFGVSSVEPRIDYQAVHDHIRSVIAAIAPNDSVERFEALGVRVIKSAARFKDKRTVVSADGEIEVKARAFVIATGSSPAIPPISGLDTVDYLTNETFFSLTERPDKLVIIGGGPIGLELAQAQRRLGAEVVVLEAFSLLSREDPELSSLVGNRLRREGITIHEGAKITRIDPPTNPEAHPHGARIRFSVPREDGKGETDEEILDASHLLVATGRTANVDGLGLEAAGIGYDRRGIAVKPTLRTSNRRVYAIGDVTGGMQFTHVAGYHAGLVVRNILFRLGAKEDLGILPRVTFTDPELAHVGFDEGQARQKFGKIRILRWPYGDNDRAQAERQTGGFIKIILNRKGVVIGASVVGANAGEIINMWALIVSQKMNIKAVTGYVSPYPTFSEIGRRAAISSFSDLPGKSGVRSIISLLKKFG